MESPYQQMHMWKHTLVSSVMRPVCHSQTHHIVYHRIAIDVTALGGGGFLGPASEERTTRSGDNNTLPHICERDSWRPLGGPPMHCLGGVVFADRQFCETGMQGVGAV